ncbi:MAG: hypothetical protein IJ572_00625 [Bacilli bacterium]|nr:hypothetical protein [Bacilli bacterium]
MYFEILALAVVFVLALQYTKVIDLNKLVEDNKMYFRKFKEEDYDFLVRAKYGEAVDPDFLFGKRIRDGLLVGLILLTLFINNMSYLYVLAAVIAGVVMFKMGYSNLKKYYNAHLHEIDSLLPHYLKGLEILIQHYTVPVALGKSIDAAPEIFKKGLQQMISQINAGDSSINPYMEFAKTYPVRDSMRMMRLLYRLGLGKQERKQEQLLTFSRSISSLQQKARETRYKERLDKMEGKTMSMLISTGAGVMILLVFAVLQMMNF